MQDNQTQKAKDIARLTMIAMEHPPGSEEFIAAASGFLDELHATQELVIEEPPHEETLEERIARMLGLETPEEPEPTEERPIGVQHNVLQNKAIKELKRRVEAGETITRVPTPPCNMAARQAGAATAPALLDVDGRSIMGASGGMY